MSQIKPCGRKACYAAVLIVAPISSSVLVAAKKSGTSYGTADKVFDLYNIPKPVAYNAPKRVSSQTIREAWADTTRSHIEIAKSLGMSGHNFYERAKKLGLPKRRSGHIKRDIIWPPDFDEMWVAGVWAKDIAAACPRPPKSSSSVNIEVKRRGLKPRGSGLKPNGISLLQFRMMQDGKRVAKATASIWYGSVAA